MSEAADWMDTEPRASVDLHTDRPHAARVYDYLLGGKTNYPADRAAAEQALRSLPTAALIARHNRAFMHRVTRYLVAEAGIRQFLDIGTGIPTSPNLHEVVQSVAPQARIVYSDNDPIVLAHSRALHASHPAGRTAYIDGDLCDPQSLLRAPELRATLDFGRPVALTLIAVLHWLPKDQDAHAVVGRLMAALPSGSHLALTHGTSDFAPEAVRRVSEDFRAAGTNVQVRGKTDVARFFDGMELLEPGIEMVQRWRPDPAPSGEAVDDTVVPLYAGVARKL